MSWYAIDAVDDAIDASRGFLFPFELRRWVRLAVIAFFLGGAGGGGGSGAANGSMNVGQGGADFPVVTVPPRVITALIALAVLAVLVGVLLALVGATMRFVFVDALRTGEVRIRGPFRRRFRQGVGLFVLTLLVILVAVALFGGGIALAVFGGVDPLVAVLVLVPLLLAVLLVTAVVVSFTNEFVVPVAIAGDVGVFAGWRRFWPTLRAQPGQFAVYVLLRLVLGIAVGIVTGAIVGILALPILVVPFAVGVGVLLGAGSVGLVEALIVATVALPFVALLILVSLVVRIPVLTYFGYYALLVLGDATPAFDLIPERRAEIRATEG